MWYTIDMSCGHKEEVQLIGRRADRERKIAWYGECGLCKECRDKAKNAEHSKGCVEKTMLYKEYKKHFSDCYAKAGSYNEDDKTIVVYVQEGRKEKYGTYEDMLAESCEEKEMLYKEYKEKYSDCKTKQGSYDSDKKTIIVYVDKLKEDTTEEEIPQDELERKVNALKVATNMGIRGISKLLKEGTAVYEGKDIMRYFRKADEAEKEKIAKMIRTQEPIDENWQLVYKYNITYYIHYKKGE